MNMNKDMTVEEAVALIKDHKIIHKIDDGDARRFYISKALDMAIESLEQEQESQEIYEKVKDLSERIEALEKQIIENKKEEIDKLKAELDYAKFRAALPTILDMMSDNRK